jgi:Ser/Thr protein kinase RdoA (MazF antagonist)
LTAGERGRFVCLHGDVHPKNAVLSGDSLTLIDLDQCGAGPAAADLGSLLAALSYKRLTGLLSPARERELAESFLAGYADARALPSVASLRWHTAAALLAERALRAVNLIRTEGLRHLPEILAEAEKLMRGGRE